MATNEVQVAWKIEARYGDYPAVALRDGWVWGIAKRGEIHAVDAASGESRWTFAHSSVHYEPTVDEEAVYFATSAQEIVAASRNDAAERWRAKVSEPVFQSPTRVGGLVIVRGIAGGVWAFDARTGEQRWTSSYPGRGLDLCRPLVLENRILLAHNGGIAVLDLGGALVSSISGQRVTNLLDDGKQLCSFAGYHWQFNLHDRTSFEITRVVKGDADELADVFGSGTVFVDGVLYAKAASTGSAFALALDTSPRLVKLGTRTEGPVSCIDDALYATPPGKLVAFDRTTRAKQWEIAVPKVGCVGPVVRAADVLVVPSEGCVVAVRAR